MKKVFVLAMLCLCLSIVQAQEREMERYIEVTGSAEMEVEPDEIRLVIGIREYWKEEFEKKSKPEEYRTKVPLAEIESELLGALAGISITKKDITVEDVGNYMRQKGKEFLVGKRLEITLKDFAKVDEIIRVIDTRGIDYMNLGELKNRDIAQYRLECKAQALKAAKRKADFLLQAMGEKTGDLINVTEPPEGSAFYGPYIYSNVAMDGKADGQIDMVRKIKLRYEMKVRFGITK